MSHVSYLMDGGERRRDITLFRIQSASSHPYIFALSSKNDRVLLSDFGWRLTTVRLVIYIDANLGYAFCVFMYATDNKQVKLMFRNISCSLELNVTLYLLHLWVFLV